MAINYDKLMAWPFEDVRHRYTQRDTMLYALGVGLGCDPCDETELRFVYEKNLLALPTLPVPIIQAVLPLSSRRPRCFSHRCAA